MDLQFVMRLLGKLLFAFSAVLFVPLIAALFYDHAHIWIFAVTLVISLLAATVLIKQGRPKPRQRLRVREAIALVGCGWLLVCFMGALPYLFYHPTDPIAALFESVSGFTTTGVTITYNFDDYPTSLLVWRSLTDWIGGIGAIMLFIVMMPQMNSGTSYLFNAELPDAVAERTLPKIKESAFIITGIYLAFTLLEIGLLSLAGVPLIPALDMAMATMASGGFYYFNDRLIEFNSLTVEIIAIVFMLISSINFALYYKIWRGDWQTVKDDREYRYYLGMLAIAACAIVGDLYFNYYMNLEDSLRHGIFQVVSIGSTTGFASTEFDAWPSFSRYILLLVMFTGGCSGSTAGGLKISRLVILFKASWAELLRILHPQIVYSVKMGKRVIDPIIVGNITRFFFLYILVFMVLTIAISLEGLSSMNSMGIIAACMSSTGPAFGVVGHTTSFATMSDWGRFVSICAMLLGRLEIFTLLAVLRPDFWRNKQNW